MSAPTFNPSKSYRPAPKKAVQPAALVDDEVQRVLDGEADPRPRVEMIEPVVEKLAPRPRTRAEELADLNKHWDAEPIPQKWLYYDKLEDLAAFGIPDAINDPRRLFVGIHPCNDDGSLLGRAEAFLENRMLNPRYVSAYQEWRSRRFPHGLPARDSSWVLRQENRSYIDACPSLRAVCPPEFMCGEMLKQYEHSQGEVHFWEEPFCRELYFEIHLTAPRFDGSKPETKEFFVMMETEGPGGSYYQALEKISAAKALNDRLEGFFVAGATPIEVQPRKMVCRVCRNAAGTSLPPPHRCSDFTEPEITPGRRG